MVEKKTRGRPRTDDPKIKFDNVCLKTSTVVDIEVVATQLKMTPSKLVQVMLENEVRKYKELVTKKE